MSRSIENLALFQSQFHDHTFMIFESLHVVLGHDNDISSKTDPYKVSVYLLSSPSAMPAGGDDDKQIDVAALVHLAARRRAEENYLLCRCNLQNPRNGITQNLTQLFLLHEHLTKTDPITS
jgi:hypothetical protein